MSLSQEETVFCPSCGAGNRARVWGSVNATTDPQLKRALLKGTLTLFRCIRCRHQTGIDHDLLYHDQRRLLLFDYRKEPLDPGDVEGKLALHLGHVFQGYTRRLIRSMPQLIEKVLVFDADLDDRVVEVLKLLTLRHLNLPTEPNEETYLFAGMRRRFFRRELCFVVVRDPENGLFTGVPLDEYHSVLQQLQPYLNVGGPGFPGWTTVDRAFGLQLAERFVEARENEQGAV